MKQIFAMVFAALVFIAAVAAEAATLRPEAVIHGEQVTLGDLFDGLPPDRAGTPIARAPALGRQVTLDARWLGRLARAHGIHWDAASPLSRIVVSRPSHRLDRAFITATVREALAGRMLGDRFDLQFDNRTLEAHLPVTMQPTAAIDELSFDPASGRFAATLIAPADGPAIVRMPVAGRAMRIVSVPVLLQRLRSNEVIARSDVGHIDMTSDRVGPDVALHADELIGMSPRRAIAANAPVRLNDLKPPTVVRRGETVTMLLRSGALAISARGRALEDGPRGALIRVVNIDSNRTIEAEIVGPGTVTVRGPAALASLN